MKEITLNDGRQCFIRQANPGDAEALISYLNKVAGETDNLSFGQDEFNITREKEKKFIEKQYESETSILLIARVDGKIVGNLGLQGNTKKRLRHRAEFGVSVLKNYWGLGIGKALVKTMIDFARKTGITKINLKVKTDNNRAISLYEKLGFEEEGTEKRGMLIDGEYVDFKIMGLLLD